MDRLRAIGEDFEWLSRNDEWELWHRASTFELLCVWTTKIGAFLALGLDLLRLDLSNCRCESRCCKLWNELIQSLRFDDIAGRYPRWDEVVSAHEEEEELWSATVRRGSGIPLDRVFFIGATGPA